MADLKVTELNTEQLEVIKALWSNDYEFRDIVGHRVKLYAQQAQSEAQKLFDLAEHTQLLFGAKASQKPDTAQQKGVPTNGETSPKVKAKGSLNHRQKIYAALAQQPGMSVGELHSVLKSSNHFITRRVLNSLLNQYKAEHKATNGKKGIRCEGDAPYTKFYLANSIFNEYK